MFCVFVDFSFSQVRIDIACYYLGILSHILCGSYRLIVLAQIDDCITCDSSVRMVANGGMN